MSTLQVANVHFEPTGNNRIQFTGSNTYSFMSSGANVMVITNTAVQFPQGITETVYTLSGTVMSPKNGTIQLKTLSANTTLTDGFANGESMTLMIDDGTGFFVTWPTITWRSGGAPTLGTTGYNVIQMWKANSTLFASYVGNFY